MPHALPRHGLFAVLLALPTLLLASQAAHTAPHDARLTDFLSQQAQEASGALADEVQVRLPASARALPPCEAAQPFLPPGGKPWGEVMVGLRCPAGAAPGWTRYVQAKVNVRVSVAVAARALPAGHPLAEADLSTGAGDLASLPADAARDPQNVVGALTLKPLTAGSVIRRGQLRTQVVIQPGQPVRVESPGPGFVLTAQGKALGSAAVGASVKLQMENGRVVSGLAQADGSVRVAP